MFDTYTYNPGSLSTAVVDFSAVGEAGMRVIVGGVAYLEKTASPDINTGQWARGASAAASATALAAAINGDKRFGKPKIRAVVSGEGDSVVLMATEAGGDFNYAVTTDSASACTVENMHDGIKEMRAPRVCVRRVVTAQDIKADQITIPVDFKPTGALFDVRTTAGAAKATDAVVVLGTAEPFFYVALRFSGSTDLAAGDVVTAMAF